MTETLDVALRTIVSVFVGGTGVQLLVMFIKRRSDIRAADVAATRTTVETDAVVVASAERSLLLADQARDRADKRAERMMVERDLAEAALADTHAEVRNLRIEVATLRREVAHLKAAGPD